MILIKVIITYFWLKSKIYLKKVPVMTNNTLAQTIGLLTSITSDMSILSYSNIYNYANIQLRKPVDSICCPHEKHVYYHVRNF